MRSASLLAMLAVLLPAAAMAQSGWRDADGKPMPQTEAARSEGGFAASLVITDDADWQKKWETPPEHTPSLRGADSVGPGGELYVLTLLSNPMLDAKGETNVVCDLDIQRPDGSHGAQHRQVPCFNTRLQGDPTLVYMTSVALKMVAEPDDPKGVWTVRVTVKDVNRGVALPLQSSFEVRDR
jgi:hypothetical protein